MLDRRSWYLLVPVDVGYEATLARGCGSSCASCANSGTALLSFMAPSTIALSLGFRGNCVLNLLTIPSNPSNQVGHCCQLLIGIRISIFWIGIVENCPSNSKKLRLLFLEKQNLLGRTVPKCGNSRLNLTLTIL